MTENMDNFLSLPLWATIPLLAAYIAIMAYMISFIWRNSRSKDKNKIGMAHR